MFSTSFPPAKRLGLRLLVSAVSLSAASLVWAHGDVVPQSVDTTTLPQLGSKWLDANPYSAGPANKEALRIGTSAYNQNCARCHGLQAISGGIAPDLRKLDNDCVSLKDTKKKAECVKDVDTYYMSSVRNGKVRNGAVYMPKFEGVMNQEAMWSIKAYLETVRERPL